MIRTKTRGIFFLMLLLTPLFFEAISNLHYCCDKYEQAEESFKIKFFEGDEEYISQKEMKLPVLSTITFKYHFFHESFLEIFREIVTPPPEFI